MQRKFKRGDPHPINVGLFYWGFTTKTLALGNKIKRDVWLNEEKLASYRKNAMKHVMAWQKENPEKLKECNKRIKDKRRDKDAINLSNWKKRNPERWKELKSRHHNKRFKSDPFYRLKCRLKTRVRSALNAVGWKKKSKTFEMLGCSHAEIIKHIESKFTDGMSWSRLREIHIDHKIPLASANSEA